MVDHGKRIENWLLLHQLCFKRHVPPSIRIKWDMELLDLPDRAAKEAYALEKLKEVENNYPFISAQEYLAQIEETKDWQKLRGCMGVYWADVPSMLKDAVRMGAVHTVRQIALHCVFNNTALLEELKALAPDARTCRALMYRPRVKAEEHDRQYPFCIREHFIYHRLSFKRISKTIITMPADVQQIGFERLVKSRQFGSEQKMLDTMLGLPPQQRGYLPLEFALFGLGYEATEQGFQLRPIPEYWTNSEYAQNIWMTDTIEDGLTFLTAWLKGCRFRFDGVSNLFGRTGYCYLTEWP